MTTLDSVEAELAAAHEAAELHREVVRHQAEEIARLTLERDRALACEAAARGLLAALSSPPSPTSALEERWECPKCGKEGWAIYGKGIVPCTPEACAAPPPEVERWKCGDAGLFACVGCNHGRHASKRCRVQWCACIIHDCGTGRGGTNG